MDAREKIISGAQKMFTTFGIRSITMDMIAENLGISKRTIYENFKDKDELLRSCIVSGMKHQKSISEDILKTSGNVIEAIIKMVKHNIAILNTINPLFFHDIKKYFPEINQHTLEINDKESLTQIIGLLKRGIQEQVFKSSINVEIVAILLSEQFKLMNNQEIFPDEKFSKAEVFENIVMNFIRGIATEKGLAFVEKYNS